MVVEQIQTQNKCLTIYVCCEDSMWQRDEFLELDGNNTVLTPADETLFEDGSKSSLAGISFQDEGLGEVSKGQYLSTGEGLLQLLEGLLVFLLPEAANGCRSLVLCLGIAVG